MQPDKQEATSVPLVVSEAPRVKKATWRSMSTTDDSRSGHGDTVVNMPTVDGRD